VGRFLFHGLGLALASFSALLPAAWAITPLPLPRPGGAAAVPIPDCAWLVKSNTTVSNWALPNGATTYWSHAYRLAPGEQLEVLADFPGRPGRATRFFSYQNYDLFGVSIDTLFDGQIQPLKPGQLNPYTPRGAVDPRYGRYRVVISHRQGGPSAANQMRAYPESPAQVNHANGEAPYAVLMLRYILAPDHKINQDRFGPGEGPSAGAGGQGGVPLPQLTLVDAQNRRRPIPSCSPDVRAAYARQADPGRLALQLVFFQENGPVFVRPAETQGVYPNDANAYLVAQATYEPGVALLLEGRVPRTPNTLGGEAPGDRRQQLRYWSICVNENAYPIPVTTPNGCLDDQQVLHGPGRSGDRFRALVVRASDLERQLTPAQRLALRQAGIFVLDWFSEDPDNPAATPTSSPITLLLRNVPSGRKPERFRSQAQFVTPGSKPDHAESVMGDYAVRIRRVPLATLAEELRRSGGR